MSAVKDMTGQRFGRLAVIKRGGSTPDGQATWLCLCDCGTKCFFSGARLRSGNVKSCGCLRKDSTREQFLKHGKRKTKLYGVWAGINKRCYNPRCKDYDRYGGRGITVCDEWRDNFQSFYDWAMANGYDENAPRMQCTIDRIDNDKGYCPDNCRWADQKIQQNNKSKSRKETET